MPDSERKSNTTLICTLSLETCEQERGSVYVLKSVNQTLRECFSFFLVKKTECDVGFFNTKCVGRNSACSIFTPKMQRRLKMTVIHLRLSRTDRYVKQIACNKKDNFVPNVGDWAFVTVSIKRLNVLLSDSSVPKSHCHLFIHIHGC